MFTCPSCGREAAELFLSTPESRDDADPLLTAAERAQRGAEAREGRRLVRLRGQRDGALGDVDPFLSEESEIYAAAVRHGAAWREGFDSLLRGEMPPADTDAQRGYHEPVERLRVCRGLGRTAAIAILRTMEVEDVYEARWPVSAVTVQAQQPR